ncbi:CHitin Synthase [Ditylenchus destructor]|uniref:CHitin Synthase n=1 Tax=Ditylenchus destructor TaxID=166010 RepID=A0AAD4N3A7_9BILA|nr:CHitin Synthase [Ditylenchus destructor]
MLVGTLRISVDLWAVLGSTTRLTNPHLFVALMYCHAGSPLTSLATTQSSHRDKTNDVSIGWIQAGEREIWPGEIPKMQHFRAPGTFSRRLSSGRVIRHFAALIETRRMTYQSAGYRPASGSYGQKCPSEAEKGNALTKTNIATPGSDSNDISQREAFHEHEAQTVGYVNDVQQTFDRSLWMDCEYLQNCNRGKLQLDEENFWDELIDTYLKPIETTVEEEMAIAKGLATLRNRISFSILLLNALLVLAVFLLQRHKDVLSIQLTPYEGFVWTKLNETTGKFEHTTEALKVDPLGMGIIFFLMGILVVQTIGMLIHRLNTLVEALHELNELRDQCSSWKDAENFKDYQNVLDEARQMIDTASYDRAHGADGYVRSGLAESSSSRNVLYKLQQIKNQ